MLHIPKQVVNLLKTPRDGASDTPTLNYVLFLLCVCLIYQWWMFVLLMMPHVGPRIRQYNILQLRCYWKQLWSRWAITGSWEPLVLNPKAVKCLHTFEIQNTANVVAMGICNICRVSHWIWDIGDKPEHDPLNNDNYIYIFRNIKTTYSYFPLYKQVV
jgi:hypothetical protein